MPVTAIIGTQWGDEGKGRIVDLLAEDADITIRCQGGANAGHTVINHMGKFALHLVPSGIFSKAMCIIGTGVVLDPSGLMDELKVLENAGVDTGNLIISDRAHIVMPYHILFDKLEEQRLSNRKIGTTLKGIGPAYGDKVARIGIQAGDLLDADVVSQKIKAAVEQKNLILAAIYNHEPLSAENLIDWAIENGRKLKERIKPTSPIIRDALSKDKNILLEGQLGTMRDIDWGAYPYITTSSTGAAGLCLGSGIPPTALNRVIGITKAYTTAVGAGPFPTELFDTTGEFLRKQGNEFGATTGRPRRTGWFDAVAVRYSAQLNGITEIALTKVDVLDGMETIKVAVGYKLDGAIIDGIPHANRMDDVQPVYEEFEGWTGSVNASSYEELPKAARRYVERLQELVGVPIRLVSIGP
ncbi:MAG TPA: adenylosuccinate synthase, partial [Armatimonadota bacterium]|nr:adenylosuccinate synthase [Armatimonadota bacterium]